MSTIDLFPTADWRAFRFGFACFSDATPTDSRVLRDWSRLRIGAYVVATHPETPVRVISVRQGTCVVVGDVFVAHGELTVEEILAEHIVSGAWDAIDDLSGRFAVLAFTHRGVTVFNDPMASRAVYYTIRAPRVVASHASLVAMLAGRSLDRVVSRYMASPEYVARRTRYLPGDLTRYHDIVALIPNNALDLNSGATSRFWPRGKFDASSFADLFVLVDEFFLNYARHLERFHSPIVGLTGGSDSRAMIAGLMAHGVRPRLITWSGLPPNEFEIVGRIVDYLGLEHTFAERRILPAEQADVLRQFAQLNTGFTRKALLPPRLAEHVDKDDLFVRGLGGEVLRGSWNSSFVRLRGSGLDALVFQFYTRAVRDPSSEYAAVTRTAYEGFELRGNFCSTAPPYDIGDLHYLEQRMGNWATTVGAELDVVMKSHIGFNSRKLFASSFGLSGGERFDKQLMYRIAGEYDAELASY